MNRNNFQRNLPEFRGTNKPLYSG